MDGHDFNAMQVALSQVGPTLEVAARLRDLLKIKSVYVIPAAMTRWEGWTTSYPEPKSPSFSTMIGRMAAPCVAYELANALVTHAISKESRPFRIGVASGSTVRGLVDAFELPGGIIESDILCNIQIEICPLAIGPLPETISSAGFIADTLSTRFPKLKCSFRPIAGKIAEENGFRISMLPDVRRDRDKSPLDHGLWKNNEIQKSLLLFDWIITGIGAMGYGQLKKHIDDRFTGHRPDELDNAIGDICSRVFNADGDELVVNDGNKFVAISFDWMKYLSIQSGRRVVAVVGGEEKYDALKTLARNCIPRKGASSRRLFNCLVTDEISARRLGRDIQRELIANDGERTASRGVNTIEDHSGGLKQKTAVVAPPRAPR